MDEWKMRPIGYIRSSYSETRQVPKGLGTKHTMEGTLEVLPEFEPGLQDIEGFSHLFILWVFHKSDHYELVGGAPTDDRPHGVFSSRSPYRPNPIGLTALELVRRDIKPYTSSVPMEKLRRGWLQEAEDRAKQE
jgi:tRNA-Thr(GGU) m(6)t(6)A37 methyltransferase TsaA